MDKQGISPGRLVVEAYIRDIESKYNIRVDNFIKNIDKRDANRYIRALQRLEQDQIQQLEVNQRKHIGVCEICNKNFIKKESKNGKYCPRCYSEKVLAKKLGEKVRYVEAVPSNSNKDVCSILKDHKQVVGDDPERLSTDFMLKLIKDKSKSN